MSFAKGSENKDKFNTQPAAATSVEAASGKVEAFLGKGSKVVGTLSFTGPVEVDGHVEGEINSQDKLIIGESAVVNARINGAEVTVRGTVNGDITASKRLLLQKPARVAGNIKCSVLGIEEGVAFEGKCSMETGAVSASKPQPQPGQQPK